MISCNSRRSALAYLAAHDVGAWVAFPYMLLFGATVVKGLALLDAGNASVTLPDTLPIAPAQAWHTWHFVFHALDDLQESLITGRERGVSDVVFAPQSR